MTTFHAYDSELNEEYPGHSIAAVSYTASWQLLRMRCHFTSLAVARVSVALLDMYIVRTTDTTERQYRVWRVGNLLRAVPGGNPSTIGIHRVAREVGSYMPAQTERLWRMTQAIGKPVSWDWAVTRKDVLAVWQKTPKQLRAHYHQVYENRMHSRNPKRELRHYMAICDEVMTEYLPISLFEEGDS